MSYLLYPWLPSSFSLTKGQQYEVSIVRTRSGREVRRAWQSRPLAKYTLQYGTLTDDERHRLLAFYLYHSARLTPFWFHDWSEGKLRGQRLGTGDGSTTQVAIVRSYGLQTDPFASTEAVGNLLPLLPYTGYGEGGYGEGGYGGTGWTDHPLDGYEPTAYVNGVATTVRWELVDNVPTVVFPVAPELGAVITADYAACRLVRFDTDMNLELFTVRLNRGNVALVEVL